MQSLIRVSLFFSSNSLSNLVCVDLPDPSPPSKVIKIPVVTCPVIAPSSPRNADLISLINETVLLTREPGGTKLGDQLRDILLDNKTGAISPRAEALMYAADRAHHVYSTIRPALQRGEIVISDRYFDSSIAYQGAGRVLLPTEVARISRWATESLTPTLTVIMDLPAEIGLGRLQSTDRLEN